MFEPTHGAISPHSVAVSRGAGGHRAPGDGGLAGVGSHAATWADRLHAGGGAGPRRLGASRVRGLPTPARPPSPGSVPLAPGPAGELAGGAKGEGVGRNLALWPGGSRGADLPPGGAKRAPRELLVKGRGARLGGPGVSVKISARDEGRRSARRDPTALAGLSLTLGDDGP